jgi:hypothetical protein
MQHQIINSMVNNPFDKSVVSVSREIPNILRNPNSYYRVGFEDYTAVDKKSSLLWDITPCSPSTFNGLPGVLSQSTELFIYYLFHWNPPLVRILSQMSPVPLYHIS